MRRLAWAFGWVGVAVWSILCAFAYGLFDIVGRLLMRNADMVSSSPETVEGVWRALSVLHGLSTGAVAVAWAVVSVLILAVPWLLDRMLSGSPHAAVPAPYGRMPRGRPSDGLIDLGPDQYSVGPAPERARPAGPVPRIAPRG